MCDIGGNIKQKRETLGISQNQFAKMAGISQPALSAIESGTKKPNIETVCMIASALKCTVSELLGESPVFSEIDEKMNYILSIFVQLNDRAKEDLIGMGEILLRNPSNRKKDSMHSAV